LTKACFTGIVITEKHGGFSGRAKLYQPWFTPANDQMDPNLVLTTQFKVPTTTRRDQSLKTTRISLRLFVKPPDTKIVHDWSSKCYRPSAWKTSSFPS